MLTLDRQTSKLRRALMQVRTTVASAVMNAGDRDYLLKTIDNALAGDADLHPSLSHKRPSMTG